MLKYFMLVALTCNLFSLNPIILAKSLQNQEISLYYYYWKDDNNDYYLGKKRNDGKYSIWLYTKQRKWKPFHNADAFDDFQKAGKIYHSVSFKDGNIIIQVESVLDGNLDNDKPDNDEPPSSEPPNSEPPLPFTMKTAIEESNTKTFKVAYYFWLNENGVAFLSKTLDNETSMWNYTTKRKWMPIYNAKKFDGFSPIGKTLESAKIDNALSKIDIGKFINPFKEEFKLKLSSNSVGDNNSLISDFLTMTPQFSWTYDQQYKAINESFIFQLTKKDGTLIYSTLLSKDTKLIKKCRGTNGAVLALPMNSFCEKSYNHINNTDDSKVEQIASIYAIYDTSIINRSTCTTDITKEENYLAKDSMNLYIFVDSTVKTQSDVTYYKDNKYMEGSIKFTFEDQRLKGTIKDLKSHINITNLPKSFSISKDLNITHKIMGANTLEVTINKTNITLDKTMINIEFLDTLFHTIPKKTQRAIINIKNYAPETPPLP